MKQKLLIAGMTALMICALCGCKNQETPQEALPQESGLVTEKQETVSGDTGHPPEETGVLSFNQNGKIQDMVTDIYAETGYSVQIPREGWSQSGEGDCVTWTSEKSEGTFMEIRNLGDISLQNAQEQFLDSDYELLEDARGGLSGTDQKGENYQQISFYPAEEGIYAVRYVFPLTDWEGIGYEVMAVCDSFSVFHPVNLTPEEPLFFPESEETQSNLPAVKPQNTTGIQDEDFVKIKDYIPSVKERLYYATTENFTGQRIYDFNEAYLRYGTVKKLAAAAEELKKQGLGFLIWDGFRPVAAQNQLWEICPDTNYVSSPTGRRTHCRGMAVDLTLINLNTGELLPMPSGFDDFSPAGDRDFSDCTEEKAQNAEFLKEIMVKHGFETIHSEWWHFSDSIEYPIEESFDPTASSTWIAECNEFISLRKTPGGKEVLTKIPAGEKFTLKRWDGKYALVDYQGMEGYVLTSYIRPENHSQLSVVGFTDTYTYSQMMADLTVLSQNENVTLSSIGKSELGRKIPVLRIGAENADCHILIHGGIHGREHMTSWLVTALADYWIGHDILSCGDVCVHIIPMVNPDGVTISQIRKLGETQRQIYERDREQGYTKDSESEYAGLWKANGLGVDPNRNFPSGWENIAGRTEPSSMKYRGLEPFSCAEASALAKYTQQYSFDATISYHASGSIIYWEYGSKQPVNDLSHDLGKKIEAVTGYPLVGSQGVEGAGYKDWVMDELGIPSLTIEIGCGDCPLNDREAPSILARNLRVIPTVIDWAMSN